MILLDIGFFQGFNTQPPKGGWWAAGRNNRFQYRFNTQPPKGGWNTQFLLRLAVEVSTHSRLKAAVWVDPHSCGRRRFQHTAA